LARAAQQSNSLRAGCLRVREDAGKFNAAKDYLAEHSAGVFGGRGAIHHQGTSEHHESESRSSALRGALDQAERTATHFVNKGAVHGKGGGQSEGVRAIGTQGW